MQRADRIGWIEWARALGALGVVLLHVFTSTSLRIMDSISYTRLAAYNAVGIVAGRWAVPAFFMITGYLLLDPAKEVGPKKARKYAMRMVGVLLTFGVFFSLLEEIALCRESGAPLGASVALRAVVDVLTASSWDHLWYVYALAVVYLLVPPIRKISNQLGNRKFALLTTALFVGVLVVPTLLRLWLFLGGSDVYATEDGPIAFVQNVAIGITCFCVGGCMRWTRGNVFAIAVGLLSLLVMLGSSIACTLAKEGDLGFIFLQGSCFACAYALGVLSLLQRVLGPTTVRTNSVVDYLAKDSFGIYLLHPLFVHLILMVFDPLLLPPILFEALLYVAVVAGSIVLTRLLRHVPLLGGLL
ncbi:MAG: acyltransferase [Atopobiaceae bacterium]|nr:acyltransferase [Atopobiaceae bacterium]